MIKALHNRRVLVLAALVTVVALALYCERYRLFIQPRRINYDGFSQIQDGMTQQQVELILGGPPGDYSTTSDIGYGQRVLLVPGSHGQPNWAEVVSWLSDEGRIYLFFYSDGTVRDKAFRGGKPGYRPPLLERLKKYLGL